MKTSFLHYIFIGILFGILKTTIVVASSSDSIRSYNLKEVSVSAESAPSSENNKFSNGNIIIADKSVLEALQHTSLSDYLSQHTSVFIKESGHGMLSSISMRGTASSHTSVSWNGLTINPLTMGQVDFSQLPLFFFDRVAIHPGGESALYGNGAIGGGISLSSQSRFDRKFSISLQETVGSYGYTFSGIKLYAGNNKIQSKTALFYNRSDNDFSFYRTDFSGRHKERQNNASYHNYGFLEELDFKLGRKQQLGFKFWHTCFFREIQPSIQNNNDISQYEDIEDRTTRVMADYVFYAPVVFRAKLAWLNDHQEYEEDVIATHDLVFNATAEKNLRNILLKEINIKGGTNVQYIRPEVYAYKDGVDEWRTDFFLYLRLLLFPRWDLTCNLRQEIISGADVPFTPSLGTSFRLLQHKSHQWTVRANVARSFKVPTLNDRYWGEMDNRYLKPEDGFNTEVGCRYAFFTAPYGFSLDLTGYLNNVSDWIMWMPRGNIWKPLNIDRVEAKGVEINCKQDLTFAKSEHSLSVNYTYTHTEVKKGFDEMRPFQGRQTPLLPEHTLVLTWLTKIRKFSFSLQGNYTGERSSSDIYDVLDAYFVANLTTSYDFVFRKHSLKASLNLNNILDAEYQNMPYKAMPGRHFYVTLVYSY